MSRIHVRRPYALAREDVRARVDRAAVKIAARYGAQCRWEGDDLCIEHAKLTARVRVLADEIVVDGKLGFGLGLFSAQAEREIARVLDEQLQA